MPSFSFHGGLIVRTPAPAARREMALRCDS
jgi:hypothetical protein